LAAESPITVDNDGEIYTFVPQSKVDFDRHDDDHTLSYSSSDGFGSTSTSTPAGTSPASSVGSDDKDEGMHCEVQLPEPFYPPSMAQVDKKVKIKPRALPVVLGLPSVSWEHAISTIDPQDKCVIFVDHLLEIS
jgi:hypothetical protein